MESRAGDLLFGKTLVFSNFQMAGKSNFTNISLARVSVLWVGGQPQSL